MTILIAIAIAISNIPRRRLRVHNACWYNNVICTQSHPFSSRPVLGRCLPLRSTATRVRMSSRPRRLWLSSRATPPLKSWLSALLFSYSSVFSPLFFFFFAFAMAQSASFPFVLGDAGTAHCYSHRMIILRGRLLGPVNVLCVCLPRCRPESDTAISGRRPSCFSQKHHPRCIQVRLRPSKLPERTLPRLPFGILTSRV